MRNNKRCKTINFRNKVDSVSSPDKSFGIILNELSLNQVYQLSSGKSDYICQQLHEKVKCIRIEKITGDSIENKTVIFKKNSSRCTERRNYVHISYITRHDSVISVLVRFIPRGDNLYIGLSGYVLPSGISWSKILTKILLTFIVCSIIYQFITFFIVLVSDFSSGGIDFQTLPRTLISLFLPFSNVKAYQGIPKEVYSFIYNFSFFIAVFFYWKNLLIRFWVWDRRIGLALRLEFCRELNNDQFDYDDMVMFSKGILHRVSQVIKEIFRREGISVDSLDEYEQNINSVNINTGGGLLQIIGSAIGINNKIV